MGGKDLSSEEIRLSKKWKDEGLLPREIAERLGRVKSTITRHFARDAARKKTKKRGRRLLLNETQVDALVAKLKDMIVKAKGRFEVTAAMLKKSARCKTSLCVMREALHRRNIYLYAMRLKPLLTEEDIEDRWQFGWDYIDKPRTHPRTYLNSYCEHAPAVDAISRKYDRRSGVPDAFGVCR